MPKLTVIDNPHDIDLLAEYLKDKQFIAYDCETTGLTKQDEIIGISACADDSEAFYIIIAAWDSAASELAYIPGNKEAASALVKSLLGKSLIMHNSVFDCMMAEAFFRVNLMPSVHTDTMILAHLLNENRRAGLKDLAEELFGDDSTVEQKEMKQSVLDNGGLLTKKSYEMYKADPYLMGKYGAKDALLTYKLFYQLVPELYEQNLDKFFYEEESMPLLRGPTYQLNTTGLSVSSQELIKLKKTLEAECLEAKQFIFQEIAPYIKTRYPGTSKKNAFNIGSSQQLSWLMFGQLKLEFGTLTKVGKVVCKQLGLKLPYTASAKRDFIYKCETELGLTLQTEVKTSLKVIKPKKLKEPWGYIECNKKILQTYATRYKWVEVLLEYQKKQKILTTYLKGIEERLRYGIIQPSFLQHGTTSGRYSSRNPNFQNLPRDDKRVKRLILARPGKVFVGADYSQLEPRVFAYCSGDKRLLQAFLGTDDFYSVIGMEVYNKSDCTPHKEGSPDAFGVKYKKLRDLSKVIALASTYGATAHQLMATTGKSAYETQNDIDAYFERFPDVSKMMTDSHEMAKKEGVVYNIFGRPRRIPEAKRITKLYGSLPHADLPYEARKLLNLSVNHRIQSTGASIVNRAAIKFEENRLKAGLDCQLVVQVHDSLVVECAENDAENVRILLQDAMENTIQLEGIKLEAIPKIGKTLADV